MRYISTRGNRQPVQSAKAIQLGMVPEGGLFVPEHSGTLDLESLRGGSYRDTARAVLGGLLSDFSAEDLDTCIDAAYSAATFDTGDVISLAPLGERRFVMELWHGPTAAFKDLALQIMPHFMRVAKRHVGDDEHTVILVATSGDTGKAALEGFRDCEGISIVVFYPEQGVSEIQQRQMVTTEGSNTHVIAVRGNFDDCQTGVKGLFGDSGLSRRFAARGYELSSANSINWGRLSPQIVYYAHAYVLLERAGTVRMGELVDFCVPTGNFSNILAGYYARRMGVPIRRLICASNRNRVLADFFGSGAYDRNREFFRTMSPSMDILISSNLERFLFELTGGDSKRINTWYGQLESCGSFEVDDETRAGMAEAVRAGWVDEERVLRTIGSVFADHGYVLDTHTAVGVAVGEDLDDGAVPVVVDATASPYKFSGSVLEGIEGRQQADEYACIERLHALSGLPVHRALAGIRDKPIRHSQVIGREQMLDTVTSIVESLSG